MAQLLTDDIVISGISARLPESDNLWEFRDHLFNGEDMVTDGDIRWPMGYNGLPSRMGKIKDLTKFDASFFGMNPRLANYMDPQIRLLQEATYEAIVDAGVDPQSLRGSNTGVFVGCGLSYTDESVRDDVEHSAGYGAVACNRALMANRTSFVFDFKGPSFILDSACAGSSLALNQAILAFRAGICDTAIVAGSIINLNPNYSLQFHNLGVLSVDGKCKCFDASANGYVRSEGITVIFLQRSSAAKRIYATVVHSKGSANGYKLDGITFPSGAEQGMLLRDVYKEANINTDDIEYFEAHGTGTKAGDPQEMAAIASAFNTNHRKNPLLIGAVKSNVGHTEQTSGLVSIAKVIISMENGQIPANLHYTQPNPDIPALADGKVKIISEHTRWNGGIVGVNSFGIGGSNAHTILKSNPIKKAKKLIEDVKIFAFSGRTEEAVEVVLKHMQQTKDDYLHFLMSDLMDNPHPAHYYRGYTILNAQTTIQEIKKIPVEKLPVWFIFPGVGCQWVGMGADLMKIEVFKNTIQHLAPVLKPYDFHLIDLIMNATEETQNINLNNIVTVTAIQVALVDCLRHVGIEPDGLIGHSFGELICAYADGCFTGEQTVLASYWRGRCIQEGTLPHGAMASVGMTWEEAKKRCPPRVFAACHNAEDNLTISGEADDVRKFIVELQNDDIFAREVRCSGVPYHTPYISAIAPSLKAALHKIITNPKERSSKWISTSLTEDRWGSDLAKTSSAEYHVNNLTSSVFFKNALDKIPKNAIVFEIAPHCLLQAILKRSIGPDATYLSVSKRNHPNNVEYLLDNLGKYYIVGKNIKLSKLYPPLETPVPCGTSMIAPLIRWDHSISWNVLKFNCNKASGMGANSIVEVDISTPDSEDYYLIGHTIDGRVLFPATGYLVLVWKALAKLHGILFEKMAVEFENVMFHRATILPKSGSIKFSVSIMQVGGEFEISESGNTVVTGKIGIPSEVSHKLNEFVSRTVKHEKFKTQMEAEDIYKLLRLRGYEYGPTFQGVVLSNMNATKGLLKWNVNWVSFMDTMLQFIILGKSQRFLALPTKIQYLKIDPEYHLAQIEGEDSVDVINDPVLNICVAGGVELKGSKSSIAPRKHGNQSAPVLEEYHFVPYKEENCFASLAPEIATKMGYYFAECMNEVQDQVKICLKKEPQVAKKILSLFKETNLGQQTNTDKEKIENGTNLKTKLKEILSTTSRKEAVNQLFKDGDHTDLILDSYLQSQFIKPLLDLVRENCSIHKLKITEVNVTSQRLAKTVSSFFASHPLMNVDYMRTVPTDEELVNYTETDKDNFECSVWDAEKNPLSAEVHLILARNLFFRNHQQFLKNIYDSLKNGGFALLIELNATNPLVKVIAELGELQLTTEQQVKLAVETIGFQLISTRSDGFLYNSYLIRKVGKIEKAIKIEINEMKYDWVDELKKNLVEIVSTPEGTNIWIVNNDQPTCGLNGLVNCLRQEQGGNRIRSVFYSNFEFDKTSVDLNKELVEKDMVTNAYRDGKWGYFCHLPIRETITEPSKHAYVNVLTRGDLSSIRWFGSSLGYTSQSNTLCDVYYAPLNFRDIMLAIGKLPPDALPGNLAGQDCILGLEFSGLDSTGRRVMGLVPAKGLATTVEIDPQFLWTVPDSWSLEDASTVPVVYSTAYYALVVRGELQQGESVLIHSGSGGVGQAAISIALSMNCTVFITVGSTEKREYLKKIFPQLKNENFSNSRDLFFEYDVLRRTNGKGVDVVLNSLSEEKLQASVRCLAEHGRFLEIGKFDLSKNTPLGMSVFLKNIAFHGILLDALFEKENPHKPIVVKLVEDGIKNGVVKPLTRTVFEKNQLEPAFRFMASGKHMGKVVIKIRNEQEKTLSIMAIPNSACYPDKTYIVTGGLGGFGLELAHWLIEKGARYLVLSSRSGVKSGYQAHCLKNWKEMGINVKISNKNITSFNGAQELLKDVEKPVGGIFNLAMVLKDGLIENQTVEYYRAVSEPKIQGTHNLDSASRSNCPCLDWFVVFSSVTSGRGNVGQTNYGLANSTMERICEKRKRDGLPALAIQWGAVGDVGVVQETMGGGSDVVIGGTIPQRMSSCLVALETFLNQNHPVVASLVLAENNKINKGQTKLTVVEAIGNVFGITDAAIFSQDKAFSDLGVDSLMTVEIRQILEKDYDLVVSEQDIRQLTFPKLKNMVQKS